VAFVSEHSETLVELDIEYRELAHAAGVPDYRRVPTVGTHPAFIAALADLVLRAVGDPAIVNGADGRICPGTCNACPYPEVARC
jgi:ferrochelatase